MIRTLRSFLVATAALCALAAPAFAQTLTVLDGSGAPQTVGAAKPGSSSYVTSGAISLTSTNATPAISAAGIGLYTYVTDIDCFNLGTYTFTVSVLNSTSTVLWQGQVPAGGGFTKAFDAWIGGNGHMTADTGIFIQAANGTGTPNIVCNLQGYAWGS